MAIPDLERPQRRCIIRSGHGSVRRLAHDPAGERQRRASPRRSGNHTFRATGITAYLSNGGALEHAQEMAAHGTKERLTQDEVERIRL